MPVFKITMTEETTKTIVAYVEAPTQEAADSWASMVEDAEAVGRCVKQNDSWGSVEDIEAVDAAPDGWRVSVAA